MKIEIVDKREETLFKVTKEELKALHRWFYVFHCEVSDDDALKLINKYVYTNMVNYGIDELNDELEERTIKFLLGKYKGKYQGFPQKEWRKSLNEVIIVAELNGFKKHPDKINYSIPESFREEITNIYNTQKLSW